MKKITKKDWKTFLKVRKIVLGPTITNKTNKQWVSTFRKKEAKKSGITNEQMLKFYNPETPKVKFYIK